MNEKNHTDLVASLDRRLSGLQEDPWLAQRIIDVETEKPAIKKVSVSIIAACILIAVTMSAALAAGYYLPGIREILGLSSSTDTEKMLQAVSYNWETEYNTATIREMLYDGQGAYIAMDVQKKNRSDILLIPAFDRKCTLTSPASALGKQDTKKGETIAEYANRKGLSVVYFMVMAQNLDKTFSAIMNSDDFITTGEERWTLALRFPVVNQNESIDICLYTTLHKPPIVPSALSTSSGDRLFAEPHSITMKVSAFHNISEEKTMMKADSIVENGQLTVLSIQEANLIKTPIATYLDLLIGNPLQTEYASIWADITPLDGSDFQLLHLDRKHYGSPLSYSDGYASGSREIELFSDEGFICSQFKVDLWVSQMQSEKDLSGPIHNENAGSFTITFNISESQS